MDVASPAERERQFLICKLCFNSIPIADKKLTTVKCDSCGHKNQLRAPASTALTAAFTLTALIFYIPANIFPFMTIEMYGRSNSSTVWQGIVSLADAGSWFIAIVIFLASVLIPLLKILILFYLSSVAKNQNNPRFNTRLYFFVEAIGRWSMLDIFLLAVLVAIMKLGKWTHVQAEFGSLMFLFVVIFTMLASAYFDPQVLWRKKNETSD